MARAEPRAQDPVIEELRGLLGERLSTSAAVREQHGHDESYHPGHPPDAVDVPRDDRRRSVG